MEMPEEPLRPQRWLSLVAAILALLMLFYYVGSWVLVGIFAAAVAIFFAYQSSRSRQSRKPRCLNCGEALNPNARECSSCGSTRWTN
jgi:hypothetical protein